MQSTLMPRRACIARERSAGYDAQEPDAAALVERLRAVVEDLAALDLHGVRGEDLGELLLAAGEAQSRLAAQEARLAGAFEARGEPRRDACLNTLSWLRFKTNMGYGQAKRRMQRVRLLGRMPELRRAFEEGAVTAAHVDAITDRTTPARIDSIVSADPTLTVLARRAEPRDVRVAVQRIVDAVGRDGTEAPPPCEDYDLRGLHLSKGYSDLGDLSGATTPALTEMLARVFNLYDRGDDADMPVLQRRTAAQRRHDALVAAMSVALEQHPGGTVDGVRAHLGVFVDLMTLMGRDELATIRPRLGETGVIDADTARHIAATTDPTLRLVLGVGPWLPITVGRSQRGLPDWLRGALQIAHPQCVAPGCTMPFSRCDVDHREAYCDGGVTALFNSGPTCHGHNVLKHEDGWRLTLDSTTGVTTWTSRDGSRVIDVPPPEQL